MNLVFDREKIQNYMYNEITSSHAIFRALKRNKLIVFVGAGMSVHLKIPSWREFSLNFLNEIYKNKLITSMDYKTKESLKNEDTKKILSICKYICENSLRENQIIQTMEALFKISDKK